MYKFLNKLNELNSEYFHSLACFEILSDPYDMFISLHSFTNDLLMGVMSAIQIRKSEKCKLTRDHESIIKPGIFL